jgi:hypothetical protein
MGEFIQKPVQFKAVKFDGGVDNATQIIDWLFREFRTEAFYRPERVIRPSSESDEIETYTEPEQIVILRPDQTERRLRPGNWIMPITPEGNRRFDIFDDESIEHFFIKVG